MPVTFPTNFISSNAILRQSGNNSNAGNSVSGTWTNTTLSGSFLVVCVQASTTVMGNTLGGFTTPSSPTYSTTNNGGVVYNTGAAMSIRHHAAATFFIANAAAQTGTGTFGNTGSGIMNIEFMEFIGQGLPQVEDTGAGTTGDPGGGSSITTTSFPTANPFEIIIVNTIMPGVSNSASSATNGFLVAQSSSASLGSGAAVYQITNRLFSSYTVVTLSSNNSLICGYSVNAFKV